MKRFPIRVQDHVKEDSIFPQLGAECHAVRMRTPVRLSELDAVPGLICLLDEPGQAHALALMLHVPHDPPRVEQSHKPVHLGMLGEPRPVKPIGVVVMAVGVVVAPAGCAGLRRPSES